MGQIPTLGFYWAGFLSMILAVLKLTIEGLWSWRRVLLPVLVVLGHNALYVAVGFVWLFFTDDGMMDEEAVARRDDRLTAVGDDVNRRNAEVLRRRVAICDHHVVGGCR